MPKARQSDDQVKVRTPQDSCPRCAPTEKAARERKRSETPPARRANPARNDCGLLWIRGPDTGARPCRRRGLGQLAPVAHQPTAAAAGPETMHIPPTSWTAGSARPLNNLDQRLQHVEQKLDQLSTEPSAARAARSTIMPRHCWRPATAHAQTGCWRKRNTCCA